MLPDSLRALAVRYRFDPERLVALADSMRVPVDSVGPVLERERFNPLTSRVENLNQFTYNTTYNIQRTRAAWSNSSDYNLVRGPLFLRNSASISIDRLQTGGRTNQRHDRTSTTELGWKLSEDYSVGGRAMLGGLFSNDVSSGTIRDDRQQYDLSVRTRQRPTSSLRTELNMFSGLIDTRNSISTNRGLSGDVNGQIQYNPASWLTNDLRGAVVGNIGRTREVKSGLGTQAHNLSGNLSGTLNMFPASRIGFNSNYAWRGSRTENPVSGTALTQILITGGGDVDGTVRLRLDNDRYLNLSPRFSTTRQNSASGGQTTRRSWGLAADQRYFWHGWSLESRFSHDEGRGESPQLSDSGGLGDADVRRSLSGTVQRQLTARINARLSARVGLSSYRYYRILDYGGSIQPARDQYEQSYRIEANYNPSPRWSTSTALDVGKTHLVHLPSASTGSNYLSRSYRAEWRWSYLLLRGLTASLNSQLGANYRSFDFVPENDDLSLDFRTTTKLNAVLNPRLSLDITHLSQQQPTGKYRQAADGKTYFLPADEGRTSELSGTVSYTPAPAFSLSLTPRYRAGERIGTLDGEEVPVRGDRSLHLDGSANLNLPVGRKGRLTGNIGRSYRAERRLTYTSGVLQPSPRSEDDFWNGALQFSWQL